MDVKIECICPSREGQTRHPDGDTVTLRDKLDFRSAVAVRKEMAGYLEDHEGASGSEILAVMSESYLFLGIEGWSLVDEHGKALEASRRNIRDVLMETEEAMAVVDAADELYSPKVLLPLVARLSRSSPPTPTEPSTSQQTESSTTPPKRSKRSSTSPTRTDGIEATSSSLVGVSSYSPN